MSSILLPDHGRNVSIEELRERVSGLNLDSGLWWTTILASGAIDAEGADIAVFANSFTLPAFAKAIVLWADPAGGTPIDAIELEWLLRAVNSLPWHSHLAAELDGDDRIIAMLVRQGFQRYYYDDPVDARIARTWVMFHELAVTCKTDVANPSSELEQVIGASAEDLWVIGMMLWTFHLVETQRDPRQWVLRPDTFVQEGPNAEELDALMERVFEVIAARPQQLRERYEVADSKYRDQRGREGHWLSEFNPLRDFPVIERDDGSFCAPFPTFAITRAIDGFYYDLLEEYAEKKRQSGAPGNPYDNELNQTLGTLFEAYVGVQLRLLPANEGELRPEFMYGPKKRRRDSTDWILVRSGRTPVLFECKARESALDVQRYATRAELRTEIGRAVGKAGRQLARFIAAVDSGAAGLEFLPPDSDFICAVVLQAPLPFHTIPDIRRDIEEVISGLEPAWSELRRRIHFVPMSVRELETAVETELRHDVPIENQLRDYAEYRESVGRLEGFDADGLPVFPRHLEEHLQERYGDGVRIPNRLCEQKWNEFCDYAQQRIFDEGIAVADAELE